MAIQLSVFPDEKVFEANAVARAKWSASTVWVQRVVAILVNKISQEDKKFKPSEISLHEIMGSKGGKSYTLIRNIAKDLITQSVTLDVPGTKRDFIVFNLFGGSVRYNEKRNTLKVCLNQDLAPQYLELKERFFAYGLAEFLSLPGVYHQLLYKFLKSWESESSITVDIADLHRILNAAPSLRTHYGRLDQKALYPAHKFINERTTLKFDYEPQKSGRKVVSVVFTFRSKPKFRKAPASRSADASAAAPKLPKKTKR